MKYEFHQIINIFDDFLAEDTEISSEIMEQIRNVSDHMAENEKRMITDRIECYEKRLHNKI